MLDEFLAFLCVFGFLMCCFGIKGVMLYVRCRLVSVCEFRTQVFK